VRLQEFLNHLSIANLQSLQWLWAPGRRRSSSKHELLRLLRLEMLSPARAGACFAALDPVHQEFLRGLLRLEGYEGDVEALVRRLPGGPRGPQHVRELLEVLAYRGFLRYWSTGVGGRGEGFRAAMPQELGDALAEALNVDTREPAVMLSLDAWLSALGERVRHQTILMVDGFDDIADRHPVQVHRSRVPLFGQNDRSIRR